jgi:tRNA threonylcarbamoyladenosine biosynthesis protein TsaE
MAAASQQAFISRSESDTIAYARRVGESINQPVVIALSGDLGAGKTVFVRGLCEGLGTPPSVRVTSPSFKLLNAYPGGRFTVYHVDAWRLTGSDAFLDLDVLELAKHGALAVEWPENVQLSLLVRDTLFIEFNLRALSETGREIIRLT